MLKQIIIAASLVAATAALAQEATVPTQAPPPAPYQEVSKLVDLPEFLPGLGTLYVDPATLPAGPFLAYDHDGKLSATVYMTPLADLQGGTAYDDLPVGAPEVTSVDIYYNAGHPGVEQPHAHVVLYHDADAKSRLAQ
ncbi:hypothetical protein Rumeso_04297 [Rubellimicrobium mesophilum DSM 19309]|uniref:Uncharacterized protein n=1 Tax=Rubellimicrobium mesophilum DSM 19309 TaxID=442562 RepID=A0A017HIT0_9RHOB|nr:hypothetical protein [Rubellimicrobium mesophilum]EYD74240.1 hypothetical protein Rumeso_04297 [Rubellimicrobium mesophilum DSM 19309]